MAKSKKKKMKKMTESTSNSRWVLIPGETMLEILKRLPLNSMFICKCVCRSWRSIITDPEFLNSYGTLWRTSSTLVLVTVRHTWMEEPLRSSNMRYMLATHVNPILDFKEWPSLNKYRFTNATQVINGLVCFYITFEKLWLYNFSTNETMSLPSFPNDTKCYKCFFGFEPISRTYKLLRVGSRKCRILTLEQDMSKDSWKPLSGYAPFQYIPVKSVCIAGTLYWLNECRNGKMIAFDLKTHNFTTMSAPKVPELTSRFNFYDGALEFKGRLAFAYKIDNHFNVVSLKGSRAGWIRQTFELPTELIKQWNNLTPFGNLPTGEIMLADAGHSYCSTPIYSYDPESQKFERFMVGQFPRWDLMWELACLSCFEAKFNPISHILKGN